MWVGLPLQSEDATAYYSVEVTDTGVNLHTDSGMSPLGMLPAKCSDTDRLWFVDSTGELQ